MHDFFSRFRKGGIRFDSTQVAFIAILFVGAFLRMYEFHDWLRFNPDQARDAIVAFDMTTGKIPLLGPVAGGTEFRLGPVTHYFSFLSGTLFGFSPSALAYPDLFFSILFLPLLFLLVSRMFGTRIALSVMLLAALSGYMVRYGRFAWNPNSMPFFTTLFFLSAHSLLFSEGRKKLLWAALFGISIGIGVQLHTFLLVLLPILALFVFIFLFLQKKLSVLVAVISLSCAIFLNIPQIISEVQTKGMNTNAFFNGVGNRTESTRTVSERVGRDALCHVRSNAFILTSLGHSDNCNRFIALMKRKFPMTHPLDIVHAILEIVFTVGGIFLLGFFAWKETRLEKRFLFVGVLVFMVALFLLIIPVSNEIAMRYFLASAFVPFVLLGAWGKFLFERGRWGIATFVLFVSLLLFLNALFLKKEAALFASGRVSDADMAILGETEPLAEFLSRHTPSQGTAHLIGMRSYRKRFHKALAYPLHLEGKKLLRFEKKGMPEKSGPVFLIRKKTKSYDAMSEIDGMPILDRKTSGRVSVFLLRRE